MASRLNHTLGLCLSASLILGGCGGSGVGGFALNGGAGAAEVSHAGLAAAYLSGRIALDNGNISDAAEQFELALEADPENVELRQQLFLLYLADGAFDTALVVAGELHDIDAAPDDASMLLALDSFGRGDFEATEAFLDQITEQGINTLVLPFLRSWLTFGRGDLSAAIDILDEDGGNGLSVVRAYHRAAMLRLSEEPGQALALLQEIIPDDEAVPTRLMIQRVVTAIDLGDAAAAQDFLATQAEIDGGNVIRESVQDEIADGSSLLPPINEAGEGMGDALLSLARALADQRGAGQALLMGQMARFVAPRMADTHIFVGELLLRDDRLEAANATLEPAVGDPLFGYEARLVRASVLRRMERFEETKSLLEVLSRERPDRTDALIALGNMHSANMDYDEAAIALGRAVERIEQPTEADWRLFYARGIAFERTDRWTLAEADFKQALELFPEQPFVLNYLGYSWVDQGLNLDEAQTMLRRAVELRPEDGFIVDSLGWAYYRLGDYDNAVLHLERAIELEPGDPVINDHLGDAYWKVGRIREARYQWERAKLFDPDDDVLAAIEDKLSNGLDDTNEPG